MKGFVLLLCIASITVLAHGLTDEEKQRVKTVHDECQADPNTHVDEEILKKLHKGEDVDKSIVGKHILCMSVKLRFQKENGDIDKEELKNKFARAIKDETKLNKAVNDCNVQKDTPEETALALLKCFHDHTDHAHGHGLHNH